MAEIEYKLEHASCKSSFWPTETVRLYANEDGIERGYRYQDFMLGPCPCCFADVAAYIGVDEFKRPIRRHPISKKEIGAWAVRKQTEFTSRRQSKLNPKKYSLERQETVNGSVLDKRSGKYFFKDAIAVR